LRARGLLCFMSASISQHGLTSRCVRRTMSTCVDIVCGVERDRHSRCTLATHHFGIGQLARMENRSGGGYGAEWSVVFSPSRRCWFLMHRCRLASRTSVSGASLRGAETWHSRSPARSSREVRRTRRTPA
jgi:hypothetical protein